MLSANSACGSMVTATPILSLDCFACPQDIAEAASTVMVTNARTIETDLASLFGAIVDSFPAVAAVAHEFEKMPFDFKAGLTG